MRLIYTLSVHMYLALSRVIALFSSKARLWSSGRKGLLNHMASVVKHEASSDNTNPVIWFHCASLGEFEQGRPVLEAFRKEFPTWRILLTFFSPSGFEVRKDYAHADHVFYLPLDTPGRVNRFLDLWKPAMVVFVKYEFWFNYMDALFKRQIPLYVISAIFRPSQHFFKWYGQWARKHLHFVSRIFVQDAQSAELLAAHGLRNVEHSGDTRFDRVYKLGQSPADYPLVKQFTQGHRVIVAGSTWPEDEALLQAIPLHDVHKIRFIIAPHEVHEERIRQLLKQWQGKALRYSEFDGNASTEVRALIIDRIGMLSSLYQYGDMALIGGGFGKGIHNTLEAATFGLPVLIGPNYKKFAEARELLARGGACCVQSPGDFRKRVKAFLDDPEALREAAGTGRHYVATQRGATDMIMDELRTKANAYVPSF